MKSILFASTALVAFAGVASAQSITLGGSANMGIRDTGDGDAFAHYEVDIDVVAAGETDNGLTFGASLDLDVGPDNDVPIGDPEIFISGAFGTLTMGDLDIATDNIGIGDLGYDGIGIDDQVEEIRNAGSANVTYSFDAAGFSALISYDLGGDSTNTEEEGDVGLLLGYTFGAFSVEAAVAYDDDDQDDLDPITNLPTGNDNTAYGLEVAYSEGPIAVAAIYTSNDNTDDEGFGVFGSYEVGAITVSAAYATTDNDDDDDYGIGATYDLGGGLAVSGAVGSVDDETVFDLGVTMAF